MDPTIEIGLLYDTYGFSLTETQKALCEAYYYDDLSLSEIAENRGISKQAVSSQLSRVVFKLRAFEEALHVVEKDRKGRELLHDLTEALNTASFDTPSQKEALRGILQKLEACFFERNKEKGGDHV